MGYLDPHANPPERHSQHQQSAAGQRLPPTPAHLRKQKRQETTLAGGGPATHQWARSTQLLREKRRRRTTWWRGGRGGGGDGDSVRSAHTNLAARKSAITRVGRSRASPPALTRLRHTACVSGCLPARGSRRSHTASAVHTRMKQEPKGRRHALANARRRVSVPMVLGESRASETGIGAMSGFTSSECERRAEAQVA